MTETSRIEMGIFLPVAQGGFIFSENAPPTPATYGYNLAVTQLAERIGLDFAMSQIKWRGFGGPTRAWDAALESITLMGLLSQKTEEIRLIGSVNILSIHPGILAKVIATICDAAPGRFGLNIVTGSFPSEMSQFGLWGLDHDKRYDRADEYIEILDRLWTEDEVSLEGDFYELMNAQSWPKPHPKPEIVCAGTSERGLKFTVSKGDCVFISASGGSFEKVGETAARARRMAAEQGKELRIYAPMMVVPGETDAAARDRLDHIIAGADTVAVEAMSAEYGIRMLEDDQGGGRERLKARAIMGHPIVGSPETIARGIEEAVRVGGLDGVMIELPDYIEDQVFIGDHVLPILESHGRR